MNKEYLKENPEYIDYLQRIINYEEENDSGETNNITLERYNEENDTDYTVLWQFNDVGVHASRVYQLEMNGFVDRIFDSNSKTLYSLTDRDAITELVNELSSMYSDGVRKEYHSFPDKDDLDGLFDDVVGYEDVKWLLKKAMSADRIVNVILVGPPGSGKTVFLRCIRKLDGASFISGKRTSGPGFTDKMFEEAPRYMCIDELDDMDKRHQEALSDYTEEGLITETKGNGKKREMETNTKTFATANDLADVLNQIEDRFTDLHFNAYTLEEFEEVCVNILTREYGATESHARDIAHAVWDIDGFGNVRKAEDVAALSDGGDPKKVLEVLDNYSPGTTF